MCLGQRICGNPGKAASHTCTAVDEEKAFKLHAAALWRCTTSASLFLCNGSAPHLLLGCLCKSVFIYFFIVGSFFLKSVYSVPSDIICRNNLQLHTAFLIILHVHNFIWASQLWDLQKLRDLHGGHTRYPGSKFFSPDFLIYNCLCFWESAGCLQLRGLQLSFAELLVRSCALVKM